MQRIKKLKPDRNIKGFLPALFALVFGACVAIIFGPAAGLKTIGVIILIYATFGLIAAIRTSATSYWVSTVYMYCLGLYVIFIEFREFGHKQLYLTLEAKFMLIWVAFFMLWAIYLLLTKRAKWRGRDVMEAAAENVDAGEFSYTPRPRPVGRLEATKEEILSFARYLKKYLVVMPYYDQDKVLLVLVKMGEEFGILFGPNINYWNRTWISMDFEGNVAVNISKEYYLDFKDNLSFDQLCESMGSLLINFFKYYRDGQEIRIIDHLNEMKIGPFS
jgi:hypothetical protein